MALVLPGQEKDPELSDGFLKTLEKVVFSLDRAKNQALINMVPGKTEFDESIWKAFKGGTDPTFTDFLEAAEFPDADITPFPNPLTGKPFTLRGTAGFAGEVITSPLNLIGIGAPTKAGKALSKAGKAIKEGKVGLEAGLAGQLAKGQRGLLTVRLPFARKTGGTDVLSKMSKPFGEYLERKFTYTPKKWLQTLDKGVGITEQAGRAKAWHRTMRAAEGAEKHVQQKRFSELSKSFKAIPKKMRKEWEPRLAHLVEEVGRANRLPPDEALDLAARTFDNYNSVMLGTDVKAASYQREIKNLRKAGAPPEEILAIKDQIKDLYRDKPDFVKMYRERENALLNSRVSAVQAKREAILADAPQPVRDLVDGFEEMFDSMKTYEIAHGAPTPEFGTAQLQKAESALRMQKFARAKGAIEGDIRTRVVREFPHVRQVDEVTGKVTWDEDAIEEILSSAERLTLSSPAEWKSLLKEADDPEQLKILRSIGQESKKFHKQWFPNEQKAVEEFQEAMKSYSKRPGYVPHVARKQVMEIVGRELFRGQKIDPLSDTAAFMLQRKIGDKGIQEINRLMKDESFLSDLWPHMSDGDRAYLIKKAGDGGLFIEDPMTIAYMRNNQSFRAVTEAQYKQRFVNDFGVNESIAASDPAKKHFIQLVGDDGIPLKEARGKVFDPKYVRLFKEQLAVRQNPNLFPEFQSFTKRALGLWRLHALVWRGAFHAQNFVSNAFGAHTAAGPAQLRDYPLATRLWYKIAGAVKTGDWSKLDTGIKQRVIPHVADEVLKTERQLAEELLNDSILEGGVIEGLFDATKRPRTATSKVGKALEATESYLQDNVLLPIPLVKAGRKYGQMQEDLFRAGLYTHLRMEGWHRAAARELVDTHLFAYRDAPQWAKNMSNVMPFFLWSYFSVPFALKQALANPGRSVKPIEAVLSSAQRGREQVPEALLPEHIKNDLVVRVMDTEKGEPAIWRLGRVLPQGTPFELLDAFKAIAEAETGQGAQTAFDYVVSMLRPDMKLGIEFMSNRSSFFARPMRDPAAPGKKLAYMGTHVEPFLMNVVNGLLPEATYIDQSVFGREERLGRRAATGKELSTRLLLGQYYKIDPVKQPQRAEHELRKLDSNIKRNITWERKNMAKAKRRGDEKGAEAAQKAIDRMIAERRDVYRQIGEIRRFIRRRRNSPNIGNLGQK